MRMYPPAAGGPIYWWLRNSFIGARRRSVRLMRAYDMNWDISKVVCNGVPRNSFNPSVNEWIWNVDTDLWNGAGGKAWFHINGQCVFTLFWAFSFYTLLERWYVNGKIDTFSKWQGRTEE
ncbi:membrane protein [Besnoitia besnoiti]|uniref:Membrane protein n=1 Tax=Besnoitia besnoiti TaxID=94643 RepID=A0A2A9MKD8_BESBE|nr:membrane protein [Besnoitia besnoiti]PFH36446.1 membrane protein [Besnoitia besnoiti]